MLGMAIRMATDLNLHRKSMMSNLDTTEGRERDMEILNRERCWLMCFVLDRSVSAQMGKPYTLREDYIIRNAYSPSWHSQRFSSPTDRPLAAYVALQQIMSRAIDSIYSSTTTPSGLREDCDCEFTFPLNELTCRHAHRAVRSRGASSMAVGLERGVQHDHRVQVPSAVLLQLLVARAVLVRSGERPRESQDGHLILPHECLRGRFSELPIECLANVSASVRL